MNRTVKRDCIRPQCPLSLEDATRIVGEYVEYYNHKRLHSAIGYIPPVVKLEGREAEIFKAQKIKLIKAKSERELINKRELCVFSLN